MLGSTMRGNKINTVYNHIYLHPRHCKWMGFMTPIIRVARAGKKGGGNHVSCTPKFFNGSSSMN